MKSRTSVGLLRFRVAVGALVLCALGNLCAAADPPLEQHLVFGPDSAPQWSAAESTVAASASLTRTGSPVLHWGITVDHFAGEVNYPIGWPRANCSLRDAEARDWSQWDYFEFWVYTATPRQTLPREPVGLALYVPDRDAAYRRPLTELKIDEWVHVRIPLSEVPRRQDVRMLQVHISESQYRHQDRLDFYFDSLVLSRYAQPTLLEFRSELAIAFADVRQLGVAFQLAGVQADQRVEVTCELRDGETVITRTALEATRGPQRVALDLSGIHISPGDYQVVARPAGGGEAQTQVRFIASPWE
jgi:hypothetical protein